MNYHFTKKYCFTDGQWFTAEGEYGQKKCYFYLQNFQHKGFAILLNLQKFTLFDRSNTQAPTFLISLKKLRSALSHDGLNMNYSEILAILRQLARTNQISIEKGHSLSKIEDRPNYFELLIEGHINTYGQTGSYNYVPLDVINRILENGLGYKHVVIHTYITKWAKINENKVSEGKMWVGMDKMAFQLGMSYPVFCNHIKELINVGVLRRRKLERMANCGHRYEFFPLMEMKNYDEFHGKLN